jgi:hypothetical protein
MKPLQNFLISAQWTHSVAIETLEGIRSPLFFEYNLAMATFSGGKVD